MDRFFGRVSPGQVGEYIGNMNGKQNQRVFTVSVFFPRNRNKLNQKKNLQTGEKKKTKKPKTKTKKTQAEMPKF